jgi:RNA polymerase sigma-70 factor (ECF subfamily)
MSGSRQISNEPEQQLVQPDDVLAGRFRAGDTSAADELVRRYAAPLLAFLSRSTGNADLAEELHQQTWISVLEHIGRFDPKGAGFKPWLFRIAANKVNDAWRHKGRQRKVEDGLRRVSDQAVPDASAGMESTEVAQRLRLAIQLLPEPQRQVVCMRYYAEMKFVEIAEALGCPLNTALGRMHKALLKLREAMQERGGA